MKLSTVLAALTIISSLPFLQGAGCRSHYAPHITGSVTHTGEAGDIRVMYRRHDGSACDADPSSCLADERAWMPMKECDGTDRDRSIPLQKNTDEGATLTLDHCPSYVGVDYTMHIVAFIDSDGDGRPSAGETYGLFGPLTRKTEAQLLPASIALDQTVP